MFDSLKKKIFGIFKKEETPENKKEKPSQKKPKKEKIPQKKTSQKKPTDNQEKVSPTVQSSVKTETAKEEIGEIAENKKPEELNEPEVEKQSFFGKLVKKISTAELTEKDFSEFFDDFEMTLLEHNVALEVVDSIKDSLKNYLVGKQFKKGEAENRILEALKEAIDKILIEPEDIIKKIKEKEGIYTIVFFGINGSGKTTHVAKIANLLKKHNISCVLAAADTFRAASIEQLKEHAQKLSIPIVSKEYLSDPASVAFEGNQYAKKHNIKVLLVDTAGRMHTKSNLLREMEKIIRVATPDLKLFVGEAIAGNDLLEQVRAFNETVGIDGLILTKTDIDEKSGAILSASHTTGKPIYFLGTGQKYDDIEIFKKETIFKGLGIE